jgi:uncharacterized protein (DUF433 family)
MLLFLTHVRRNAGMPPPVASPHGRHYMDGMRYQRRTSGPAAVTSRPGVMGGMPCIDGTRVPAETVLACINGGETLYDIFSSYPHLTIEDIDAVIDWALANGRQISLPVRRVPYEELAGRGAQPGLRGNPRFIP